MILYHGSIVQVQESRMLRTEIGHDFGSVFYTTDIQAQAERRAVRKARIESWRPGNYRSPIVSVFERDDSCCSQSIKRFEEPSMDWLEMVVRCRSNSSYQHGYDIVIGKIANDNVGETVSYMTNTPSKIISTTRCPDYVAEIPGVCRW